MELWKNGTLEKWRSGKMDMGKIRNWTLGKWYLGKLDIGNNGKLQEL